MVTKQEIFGGQGALTGGISGVIQRRQTKSIEKGTADINTANLYVEKINKGEITNISQIPNHLLKYMDITKQLNTTKSTLSSKISESKQKVNNLKQEYETKLENLKKETAKKKSKADSNEERRKYSERYDIIKDNLQAQYYPEISYYNELATKLNEQVSNIESGNIISIEYATNFAENYANYQKRKEEAQLENRQLKTKYEQLSSYAEKVSSGEMKLEEVPQNYKQYLKTPQKTEYMSSVSSGGITYLLDSSGKVKGIEDSIKGESRLATSSDIANFEKLKKESETYQSEIKRYKDLGYKDTQAETLATYSLSEGGMTYVPEVAKEIIETERYKDLGYPTEQAKVLAQKSLSEGGITYTPPVAREIITKKEFNTNTKQIFNNISKIWSDLYNNYKKDLTKWYGSGIKEKILSYTKSISSPTNNIEQGRNILSALNDSINLLMQGTSYGISYLQYKDALKNLKSFKSNLNKLKNSLNDEEKNILESLIKNAEDRVSNLENTIISGGSTTSSKLATIAGDITLDFIIPGKAYLDLTLLANQIFPKKESFNTFSESVKEEGFANSLRILGSNVYNTGINFLTNKEEKLELEKQKYNNLKEIAETEKKITSGEYDKDSANKYITDLKYQNKQIDEYKKQLKSNSLLTYGTLGFIAITLGKGLNNKLKNKKISFDYETAKKSANDYNNLEAGKVVPKYDSYGNKLPDVYVQDTYSDLKFVGKDIDTLENLKIIGKKGLDPSDIDYVGMKITSKEINSGVKVLEASDNFKESKVKYYTLEKKPNYYQNTIDYTIQLKNGKILGFSIVSKSNKNLIDLWKLDKTKQISNALNYGTNKKILISSKLKNSDIIQATQYRTRAGVLTAEDYFLGKGVQTKEGGITYVKRKAKVIELLKKKRTEISKMSDTQLAKLEKTTGLTIDEIYKELNLKPSAESYWGISEPIAIAKTKKIKDSAKTFKATTEITPFPKSTDEMFFGKRVTYKKQSQIGTQKVRNYDYNVDTSTLQYIVKKNLEKYKTKPSSKSYKTFKELDTKVKTDIRNGKTTTLLKTEQINKLSLQDFAEIQSGISSTLIPDNKFKKIKTETNSKLKTTNYNINKLEKISSLITSDINKLSATASSLVWAGSTKNQKDSILNNLSKEKQKLEVLSKTLSKQETITEQIISSIQDELTDITQINQTLQLSFQAQTQQSVQLNQTLQQTKLIQYQINQLNNVIKNNLNRIKTISSTTRNINIIPTLPKFKGKTAKETRLKPDEYGIFARKYGKDILVKKTKTKRKAKKGLFDELENTLRASGYIKKGNRKIKIADLSKDFRYSKVDPFRVVEKVKSRIDTKGEKRELKRAKSKAKKTRKKTAERFWFG